MSKTLERITFFTLGALVCSLGYLIGASENPTVANPELPEHVTFKSITLADDEATFKITPQGITLTDENGYIQIGHMSYFPLHMKNNWLNYVLKGAIRQQLEIAVVDNSSVKITYEDGAKITRYKK